VVPTYNYGRYVAAAVASALQQTRPPDEVVVIDDGSTDDTRARLAEFGDRIRYSHQENRGLSAARNAGLRAARGDYVALLDSDDVWHPRKLEHQAAVLAAQASPPGLLAAASFGFEDERALPAFRLSEPRGGHVELSFRELLGNRAFCPSSVVLHRSSVLELGGFDESLRSVEDLDMWLRVRARLPVLKLRAELVALRSHPDSMSHRLEPMRSSHRRVLEQAFASIPALHADWASRRVAWARFHGHSALLRRDAGDRRGALADLARSALQWPLALCHEDGSKARGYRLKLGVATLLGRGRR
jgi:glycosyltransferase involved in cell wall biosynthesis